MCSTCWRPKARISSAGGPSGAASASERPEPGDLLQRSLGRHRDRHGASAGEPCRHAGGEPVEALQRVLDDERRAPARPACPGCRTTTASHASARMSSSQAASAVEEDLGQADAHRRAQGAQRVEAAGDRLGASPAEHVQAVRAPTRQRERPLTRRSRRTTGGGGLGVTGTAARTAAVTAAGAATRPPERRRRGDVGAHQRRHGPAPKVLEGADGEEGSAGDRVLEFGEPVRRPLRARRAPRGRASSLSAAVLAAASGSGVETETDSPEARSVDGERGRRSLLPAQAHAEGERAQRDPSVREVAPQLAHVRGGQPEQPVLDGDPLAHVQRDCRVASRLETLRLRLAPGRVQVDDIALGDRLVELDLDRARRLVRSRSRGRRARRGGRRGRRCARRRGGPRGERVVNEREKLCSSRSPPLRAARRSPHGSAIAASSASRYDGGRHADVGGVLHAALDLDARDAGGEQVRQDADRRQVAGRHDA